jgi:hypothetical protein
MHALSLSGRGLDEGRLFCRGRDGNVAGARLLDGARDEPRHPCLLDERPEIGELGVLAFGAAMDCCTLMKARRRSGYLVGLARLRHGRQRGHIDREPGVPDLPGKYATCAPITGISLMAMTAAPSPALRTRL